MKKKKYYIVIVVAVFFVVNLIILNTKYDRFYRINGINNENRILIERYLSPEDQNYLIDNYYSVDQFIHLLTTPGFNIRFLEYYEFVEQAAIFSDYNNLITQTNMAVNKLSLESQFIENKLRLLVLENVIVGFNESSRFDFDKISLYQILKEIYPSNDGSYVDDLHFLLGQFEIFGFLNESLYETYIMDIKKSYSFESLKIYINNESIHTKTLLVFPINSLTTLNKNQTLINYEPNNLVRAALIHRMMYFMDLEEETYLALINLMDDLGEEIPNKMLLMNRGYEFPESLFLGEATIENNEFQFGTSIEVFEQGLPPSEFESSILSDWLEKNSYLYGFILRYPRDKETETSSPYNPMIYRYVGVEVAKEIYQKNLSLEAYNLLLKGGNYE